MAFPVSGTRRAVVKKLIVAVVGVVAIALTSCKCPFCGPKKEESAKEMSKEHPTKK
jgi:hypothetical protein